MHNKPEFLALDINAAKKIVQTRDYQSTEYRKGQMLAKTLKEGALLENDDICATKTSNDGITIFTNQFDKKKTLVFDLEHFKAFSEFPEREALVIFQKSCRLAIKVWDDMGLGSMERAVDNRFIILLPLSFKTGYFKVGFDKVPDQKRQTRRDANHFLIFNSSNQQFELDSSTTNFRKALESYKELPNTESFFQKKEEKVIEGYKLEGPENGRSFVGFGGIEGQLTEAQKGFIRSTSLGPSILEGAAGTGKTLSLILRCINILKDSQINNKETRVLFITHSSETKANIISLIESNGGEGFIFNKSLPEERKNTVEVSTLQEWCIDLLGNKISETEYLDNDARDSKELQLLYINEIFEDFKKSDLKGFSRLISKDLYDFFTNEDSWAVSEMLQNEVSVYIKGRANEELDRYKKLSRSKYAIPIKHTEDYECIYALYNKYNERLMSLGQFDSDDIVLTAIGELETPIWRRRRAHEGFDTILIDETHLFNLNELCIFHYLTRPQCANNIIFTIDRSQALGDSTLTTFEVNSALRINDESSDHSGFQTIFRSSSDIIALASHVLSSGATLFTNLENPLEATSNSFTMEEEKKSKKPYMKGVKSDQEILQEAFNETDNLSKAINSPRYKIAIIPTTDLLLQEIEQYALTNNKPHEIIKKRGDIKRLKEAEKGGKFIISGMDYVGGLEFDAVVLVGADKGRLPPIEESGSTDSKHYLTYASYNRLYVAITRARFAVAILYSSTRGPSALLKRPLDKGVLDKT